MMVSYNFKYQNLRSFLIMDMHCNFMPVFRNMKWVGEHGLIMQRDNANLLYKKVQDKRDEQVNFVYDFELEHTRRLVRPASL